MNSLQAIKQTVRDFYQALDAATANDAQSVLESFTAKDYFWRGMHPFYEKQGAAEVNEAFWLPFKSSFTSLQRRQDIFMAGKNSCDDGKTYWVVSMGHLMGLFDKDWLHIPPTKKMTFLPYCDFHKIEEGKIVETASFCDIISVMQQAGVNPLPPSTGAFFIQPGPLTHDGLLFDEQPAEPGIKTLALIEKMVNELNNANLHSPDDELRLSWHEDMIWFGPAGIGSSYTIKRYQLQHQGPFRQGLADVKFNGHIARIAEGNYGGFFGWANLNMRATGGFLGMTAAEKLSEMRVIDIYRRDGDKLAENWIFIDLLHFLKTLGLDILERQKALRFDMV